MWIKLNKSFLVSHLFSKPPSQQRHFFVLGCFYFISLGILSIVFLHCPNHSLIKQSDDNCANGIKSMRGILVHRLIQLTKSVLKIQ